MELTNKKALPLVVVKEISRLRILAREIAKENSDIAIYTEDDTAICEFQDRDKKSDFFLRIDKTELSSNPSEGVVSLISRRPLSEDNMNISSYWAKKEYIIGIINAWLSLIREYNETHLTEAAQIDAAAEKELYDLFDFVDEDAATAAFDTKQQLLLDTSLADVIEALEEKKEAFEVAEIIEEVKDLKQAIPVTTKKDFGQKFSKILVKVKKKSISLFKYVMKEFLKEMVKKGIETGFPKMLDFFQ
jgi:hypothetical protein